jgi:hypothetical protein
MAVVVGRSHRLVHRLLNPLSFVAFKMGRLRSRALKNSQLAAARRSSRDLGDGKLTEVEQVADKITVLRDGRIVGEMESSQGIHARNHLIGNRDLTHGNCC